MIHRIWRKGSMVLLRSSSLHHIDRLSRVHIIDSYDKLVHFLGKLDTPAEHYVIALIDTEGR